MVKNPPDWALKTGALGKPDSGCQCVVVLSLSGVQLFRNPMDRSPPASFVHEISQARILEWVAVSFSRGSSQPRDQTWVSCIDRWIIIFLVYVFILIGG